ncbi:hypothetical protein ACFL5F_07120 [Planctomycetota bacterium]
MNGSVVIFSIILITLLIGMLSVAVLLTSKKTPALSEKQPNEKGIVRMGKKRIQRKPRTVKVFMVISSMVLLSLLIYWINENGSLLKRIKLGDRNTIEDKSVVVGVEDAQLYSDSEKEHSIGKIPLGTKVGVHSIGWKSVKVSVPNLGDGWVYRWQLCTSSELQKRKAGNYVPKSISWVSYTGTDEITHRGIRTGTFPLFLDEVIIFSPGIAYWLDQSWIGHECKIGNTIVTHDMNTAFMNNGKKRPVLRLDILWNNPDNNGL